MPKTARATMGVNKILDYIKVSLNDRHDDELGDAVANVNGVTFIAAIPAGNKDQ
jgi:hypothetical protein